LQDAADALRVRIERANLVRRHFRSARQFGEIAGDAVDGLAAGQGQRLRLGCMGFLSVHATSQRDQRSLHRGKRFGKRRQAPDQPGLRGKFLLVLRHALLGATRTLQRLLELLVLFTDFRFQPSGFGFHRRLFFLAERPHFQSPVNAINIVSV